MKQSNASLLLTSWVVHGLLFFLLMIFVLSARLYPYADDWAYLSPLNMHSGVEYVKWLFMQHVDHRIPIQKALHSFLAIHTGFDFRVLIFLNVLIALLISLTLVESARIYRGYRHIGDMIIPLILLSPVMGYSLWAFQFQFLSSILFVSTSFYFFCKYVDNQRHYFHTLALSQLVLCALCGMNGVIFSTVLIVVFAVISILHYRKGVKISAWSIFLIAFVFLENSLIWFLWTPSAASTGSTNVFALLECFFKLLPASMLVYTFNDAIWNVLIVLCGLLLAFFSIFRELKSRDVTAGSLLALAVVLASLAIILSVAIARSKGEGNWDNTLIMHYGTLTILLPIFCWIIISNYFSNKTTCVAALVFVVVFACAYYKNFEWRYDFAKSTQETQRMVGNAFKENSDANEIVEKFNRELTWSDTGDAKLAVVIGIEELRKFGYPLYTAVNSVAGGASIKGLARQKMEDFYSNSPVSTANDSVTCKGSIDLLGKITPAPSSLSVVDILDISGWVSLENEVADDVYIVLNDSHGARKYFEALSYERPDVSTYFKNDKLKMAGFSASLDLSKLPGTYTLTLLIERNQTLTACNNLNAIIKVDGGSIHE